MHRETLCRAAWNEQERTREEHDLVYEISWIEELGLWRTFLRSHEKVQQMMQEARNEAVGADQFIELDA